MAFLIDVSDERRARVHEMVSDGSNPRPAFFVLVAISTLIAAFGLLSDSTAVVIGAMLVAPLMTPILGLALALVRGDAKLLGYALRAEGLGILIAVAASTLLGLAIPYFEATPEMLSRTRPNLLDLLVAVLAGLAGAYAMVEERLSPMLPGVAISTAIVPPLANTGLSLSIGAYEGASGSFLLFFTNFLSILLVSAFVFYLSGMAGTLWPPSTKTVARRFGLAAVGFLIVGVFLSVELSRMLEHRRMGRDIRVVLRQALADLRATGLVKLVHERKGDEVVVLAHVDAPGVVAPARVKAIEQRLEETLGVPIDLFLRTTLTREVSSAGAFNNLVATTLDGFTLTGQSSKRARVVLVAEQIIREYLGDRISLQLEGLQSVAVGDQVALIAEVTGARRLRRGEIGELEERIQAQVTGTPVRLAVRHESTGLSDRRGAFRTELTMRRPASEHEQAVIDRIHNIARTSLREAGYRLDGWSVAPLEGTFYGLFEVKGPRLFTREELLELKGLLEAAIEEPLEIYVRSVPETVVSEEGHTSLEELLASFDERTQAAYGLETRELIEGWR